jgi:hypothetical protein
MVDSNVPGAYSASARLQAAPSSLLVAALVQPGRIADARSAIPAGVASFTTAFRVTLVGFFARAFTTFNAGITTLLAEFFTVTAIPRAVEHASIADISM